MKLDKVLNLYRNILKATGWAVLCSLFIALLSFIGIHLLASQEENYSFIEESADAAGAIAAFSVPYSFFFSLVPLLIKFLVPSLKEKKSKVVNLALAATSSTTLLLLLSYGRPLSNLSIFVLPYLGGTYFLYRVLRSRFITTCSSI